MTGVWTQSSALYTERKARRGPSWGGGGGDLSPARLDKAGWVIFWASSLSGTFGIGALWAGSARKEVTRKVKAQSELSALQSKLINYEVSSSTQHLPLSDEDKVLYQIWRRP